MKCPWCGWRGDEEELDFDEHDVPMYCPDCGKIAEDDGEIEKICKKFMEDNPNHEAWFDSMEAHAGYYPVVITDKHHGERHALKIPARYVFESIAEFRDWTEGVVLD